MKNDVRIKLYLNPLFVKELRRGFMAVTGEHKAAADICRILVLMYFRRGAKDLPNMDDLKAYLPEEFDNEVAPVTMSLTLAQADLLSEVQKQVPFKLPFATIVHQVLLLALGYSLETILETVNKENLFKTKEEVLKTSTALLPTRKDGTMKLGTIDRTNVADSYLI